MGAGRNREDGEGSRRCHFSRPSPCARLVQGQGQRRAREKVVRGSQCGSSEAGIDHLASRCLRACQPRFPTRGLAPSQPSTDLREGCRCISGRIPFSAFCARLPACALPAGGTSWRAGLAPHCGSGCGPGWERRGRVGCVSSRCYPSPGFFSPSEREVPSFCGESRLYRSVPSAVAGLWRTR